MAAKVRVRMARDSRPLCSVKASTSFDSLVPSCTISVILKLLVWATLRPWFVMILLYSLYCGFVNLCTEKNASKTLGWQVGRVDCSIRG